MAGIADILTGGVNRARVGAVVGAAVLSLVCIRWAFAMGELVLVTKDTQAKQGLKFSLTAERISDEVVMVDVEIPREGKLKALRAIGLSLGKTKVLENGSPALSAPLQPSPGKNGSWTVHFQLAPDLANRCSVDLNVPDVPGSYTIYAIELKGYITASK